MTGRKIIVDTYGGVGSHVAVVFQVKIPQKLIVQVVIWQDMSRKYCRVGLAEKAEIQVAYAIGVPEPLAVTVNSFNTGKIDDEN